MAFCVNKNEGQFGQIEVVFSAGGATIAVGRQAAGEPVSPFHALMVATTPMRSTLTGHFGEVHRIRNIILTRRTASGTEGAPPQAQVFISRSVIGFPEKQRNRLKDIVNRIDIVLMLDDLVLDAHIQ